MDDKDQFILRCLKNADYTTEYEQMSKINNIEVSTENAISPPLQHPRRVRKLPITFEEETRDKRKRKRKSKPKYKIERIIKELVLFRDGYRCTECGRTDHLHIHHIIYRSNGGTDSTENLTTLCQTCHKAQHKGQNIHNIMRD